MQYTPLYILLIAIDIDINLCLYVITLTLYKVSDLVASQKYLTFDCIYIEYHHY